MGAAHGFLPGQEPLAAADFSGGAATVGRLLSGLGFQVTQAVPGLTTGELVELLSALRPYRSPAGREALYQPLTLLWAIGRAHQGLARMAKWSETKAALGEFLEGHGEHPRAHYPVTALYHAGLWDLGGPRPVPPAHGDVPLSWFTRNQPAKGKDRPGHGLYKRDRQGLGPGARRPGRPRAGDRPQQAASRRRGRRDRARRRHRRLPPDRIGRRNGGP